MENITIPPKNRPEWKQIVSGEIHHRYNNYVLQMKVHQAMHDIASSKTTVDQAVEEIFDLCSKYSKAVQSDFRVIFKTW